MVWKSGVDPHRVHFTTIETMSFNFDFELDFDELLIGRQPGSTVVPEFEIPDGIWEVSPFPLPWQPEFDIPDMGWKPLPLPLPWEPEFEIPDWVGDLLPLPLPLDPEFEIPDLGWEPLPLPLPLPWDPELEIPDLGWEPLPLPLPLPEGPDFKIPEWLDELPLPEFPGGLGGEDSETVTPVNRLYNSSEGRHLFSANENEIDILTGNGWEDEGALYLAPEEGSAEVFRFYVATENRHFYTALEGERDMIIGDQDTFAGWQYEGAAFSAYSTSDYPEDSVAVFRYLNQETGNHLYSTSTFEQAILNQDSNWLNEGVAWYGDELPVVSDFI